MLRTRSGLAPVRLISLAALLWAAAGMLPASGAEWCAGPCEGGRLDAVLYLVGDAGAAAGREPALVALGRDARARVRELGAARVAIAFLGDLIYPAGLPPEEDEFFPEARRRLETQLAAVRHSEAQGFFVPGNHDWDQGWEAVLRLERYLEEHAAGRAVLRPGGGCPGPEHAELGRHLVLVFLDTQWWLHRGARPRHPDSACPTDAPGEVTEALRGLLAATGSRQAVVMAHHPLRSGGPHGGGFPWHVHLFPLRNTHTSLWIPLPGIGSLVPLARWLGVTNQDVSGPRYRALRRSLREAFAPAPPLVYAAGHDHSLQVLGEGEAPYVVVSGAGNRETLSFVVERDDTLVARRASGYVRVEALADGRVRIVVVAVEEDTRPAEIFRACLNLPCS